MSADEYALRLYGDSSDKRRNCLRLYAGNDDSSQGKRLRGPKAVNGISWESFSFTFWLDLALSIFCHRQILRPASEVKVETFEGPIQCVTLEEGPIRMTQSVDEVLLKLPGVGLVVVER